MILGGTGTRPVPVDQALPSTDNVRDEVCFFKIILEVFLSFPPAWEPIFMEVKIICAFLNEIKFIHIFEEKISFNNALYL